MPPNREKLSVAGLIRVDRTFPVEVVIVEALIAEVAGNQVSPTAVVAKALLEGVNGAAKQGNRATVVVQAVKAHPHEVEVEVAGVDAPAAVGAVAEAAVAEVDAPEAAGAVAEVAVAAVDAGN